MTTPSAPANPRACLISFSPIADDPRVRRHGDTLHAHGWTVAGVGLPGGKSPAPPWRIIDQVPRQAETPQPMASAEKQFSKGD